MKADVFDMNCPGCGAKTSSEHWKNHWSGAIVTIKYECGTVERDGNGRYSRKCRKRQKDLKCQKQEKD